MLKLIYSDGDMGILFIFVTCLCFNVMSTDGRFFLTIGFGDLYPASEAGRPVFIVYALLAVPTITVVGIF